MNQIICFNNQTEYNKTDMFPNRKKFFVFFKFQFIFCSILAIIITGYFFYLQYDKKYHESISSDILHNINITNLYENTNTNYIASHNSTDSIYHTDSNIFSIVGIIEIKSIGINYPIINEFSYDLLKIAPCKFYGPNPNEIGNFCIAGHNYNNYQFFSRLKKLNIGDIITIYDLSSTKINYEIYDSYETDFDNISCTSQDTNGKKEITLITCNNIKNRRRVIKAYEKG